jgi:hypothetical protein
MEAEPYIDDERITLEVEMVEAAWLVSNYQELSKQYGEEHKLVREAKNEAIRKTNLLKWKTDEYVKRKQRG